MKTKKNFLVLVIIALSTFLNAQTVEEVISSGTSGDATLKIEADTDNNNENDNPRIKLSQDGGLTNGYIGLNGDSNSFFNNGLEILFFLNEIPSFFLIGSII